MATLDSADNAAPCEAGAKVDEPDVDKGSSHMVSSAMHIQKNA